MIRCRHDPHTMSRGTPGQSYGTASEYWYAAAQRLFQSSTSASGNGSGEMNVISERAEGGSPPNDSDSLRLEVAQFFNDNSQALTCGAALASALLMPTICKTVVPPFQQVRHLTAGYASLGT